MPRKTINETEKKNRLFAAQIRGGLTFCQKTSSVDMAKMIGAGAATAARRLRNPENFTIGELRALKRNGVITEEQILSAI